MYGRVCYEKNNDICSCSACTYTVCLPKEDNPVVQGSEYVSEESSEMESIGDMREQQIADAEAALQDMQ